eukprot:scaffold20612_cov73-Skeletonema_marinoi.AAC.2
MQALIMYYDTDVPSLSTETMGVRKLLFRFSFSPEKPPKLGHTPLLFLFSSFNFSYYTFFVLASLLWQRLDPVDISISVTCACNCLRSLRQQTTNYEELKAEADVSDQFQLNPHNSQQTSAQTQSP